MGMTPTWSDPVAFSKAVDEYFDNKEIYHTWSGLALHLGFESRQSLEDYKKKEGFSYPIKKALLRIEAQYEKSAMTSKNAAGAIFALKNFGWRDKQEIEQKTTIEDDRIDESKLTDEELRILIEIQRKGGTSKA